MSTRYQPCIEQNLCVHCAQRPPEIGRYCQPCHTHVRQQVHVPNNARAQQGLCQDCGKSLRTIGKRCQPCHDHTIQSRRALADSHRQQGR